MRSAGSTTVEVGRHRLDRLGAIAVSTLVTVVRRGFLVSLFRGPRHRADARRETTPRTRTAPAAI